MRKLDSEDFTSARYESICRHYLSHFRCILFTESAQDGSVLVRHDVDFSLDRAVAMARVEQVHGLRSTFFVDPLSAYYSIFEPSQRGHLAELVQLGHQVGLHFDASRHNFEGISGLERAVEFESGILEEAGAKPVAISFHNPRSSDLEFTQSRISGLVNAYSKELFRDVNYVSDSNGYWRFQSVEEVLERQFRSSNPLQILIHPEWWQDSPMPPRARIFRSLLGRTLKQLREYDEALRVAGRENRSGRPEQLEGLILEGIDSTQQLDVLWTMGLMKEMTLHLSHLLKTRLIDSIVLVARLSWGIPNDVSKGFLEENWHSLDFPLMLKHLSAEPCKLRLNALEFESLQFLMEASVHNRMAVGPTNLTESIEVLSKALRIVTTEDLQFVECRSYSSSEEATLCDHLDLSGATTPDQKWEMFKHEIAEVSSLGN